MNRRWRTVPALVALAVTGACSAPANSTVEQTVRDYVSLRNNGDLQGMLGKSCGSLYTSTSNLLAQGPDEQRELTASLRAHPVDVTSVVVDSSGNHVFATTMTGSAQTAHGRETASQHVEVRRFQDGYRICAMKP